MDGGDWISLAGVIVAGGSAIWAVVSARGARTAEIKADGYRARAEQDARRAIEAAERAATAESQSAAAAQRAADALEKQNQLLVNESEEVSRAQARAVIVRMDIRNGRRGLVVHNGSNEPIHKLYVDLVGVRGSLHMAWTRGVDPVVTDRAFSDVLLGGKSTIENSIFVCSDASVDLKEFLAHFRIRFRDSRNVWWERVGNSDPVQIEPLA